jgi:hypothetical protein
MPTKSNENLVELLATAGQPKRWLERKIAEMAQGVVAALRDSSLAVDDAWDELFNLENYLAIRKMGLDRDLKSLFEWGMELSNVARLAPESLPESFDAMAKLARRVMRRSQLQVPARKPRRGVRRASRQTG